MCQLKSALILKDKTYCPLDYDNHSQMIKDLKLDDTTKEPNFVRVEMIPINGNIFNHNLKNWQLKIDQDFKPSWFTEKFALSEMQKEIQKFWKERFLIDSSLDEIKEGRWYLKNGTIDKLTGNAIIEQMWGSSQVGSMRGSSQVRSMWESSQVGSMQGSSRVGSMRESSQVKNCQGDIPIIYVADKSIKLKVFKNKERK